MEIPKYPVSDIRWVLEACRADEALKPDDPRRHDFTKLLGGSVVRELAETLGQNLRDGRFHQCVLTGHQGSGKSTQLRGLEKWANENGFLTVWNEVDVFFGQVDLQFSDLYLLAASSIDRALRENGTPLPAKRLKGVEEWFAETVQESKNTRKSQAEAKAGVEAGGGFPFLGKLIASFSASVVAGSEHSVNVRSQFRQAPDTLIAITNELLDAAGEELRKHGRPRGVLIIFDNLDRYHPDTVYNLLIKGETLMSRLGCHVVFTMPVALRWSSASPHQDAFDATALLPMIPLRTKDAPWRASVSKSSFRNDAVKEMVAALEKRIDVQKLFEKPADAVRLVKSSGGSIRDLLHLVNQARQQSLVSLEESPDRITRRGVERGIREYREIHLAGLSSEDRLRLVRIARRESDAFEMDVHLTKLLSRRWVLYYANDHDKWYDIHPLIVEDEGFRRAFEAEDSDEADQG